MERNLNINTIYDSKAGPGWVLLVEDDTIIAEGLGEGLRRHGYRPVYSTTVGEAMSKLANQQFSIILLDIRLVRGSGEQIIQYLKSHAGPNHNTPIMVMSAFVDIELIHRVRAMVDGVLVKPFNLLTLVNRVNGIIKERLEDPKRFSKLHPTASLAPTAGKPGLEDFWETTKTGDQMGQADQGSQAKKQASGQRTTEAEDLQEAISFIESQNEADAAPAPQTEEEEIKSRFYSNVERSISNGNSED